MRSKQKNNIVGKNQINNLVIISDGDKANEVLKLFFSDNEAFNDQNNILNNIFEKKEKNRKTTLSKVYSKISSKKVNKNNAKLDLKILIPIIEYISLEDKNYLQERWANLISNIFLNEERSPFVQNCVEILNKLSADEIKILDIIYDYFISEQAILIKRWGVIENFVGDEYIDTNYISIPADFIKNQVKLSFAKWNLYFDNLSSHELVIKKDEKYLHLTTSFNNTGVIFY